MYKLKLNPNGKIIVPTIGMFELGNAIDAIEEAKNDARWRMPKGRFAFDGISANEIYFNISCKVTDTNEKEMLNITMGTRFKDMRVGIIDSMYCGHFRMTTAQNDHVNGLDKIDI